jgi:hypothetical protein
MNEVVNPGSAPIPKIFGVCDQTDTAPVWGYIVRQQGLMVILETSLEKLWIAGLQKCLNSL